MNERDIERTERMKEILLKQVELLQEESVKLIREYDDIMRYASTFMGLSEVIGKLTADYALLQGCNSEAR